VHTTRFHVEDLGTKDPGAYDPYLGPGPVSHLHFIACVHRLSPCGSGLHDMHSHLCAQDLLTFRASTSASLVLQHLHLHSHVLPLAVQATLLPPEQQLKPSSSIRVLQARSLYTFISRVHRRLIVPMDSLFIMLLVRWTILSRPKYVLRPSHAFHHTSSYSNLNKLKLLHLNCILPFLNNFKTKSTPPPTGTTSSSALTGTALLVLVLSYVYASS
jgi:hypothetical protein